MTGQTISHYRVLEKLGEGGMGVVYKAQDTKLERPVALKFLPARLLGDADIRKRFEREAKAAAALNHANLCTVYEIDEVDGQTFIAMELVEGESLDKKIARGPLKFEDALDICRQAAKGLEAAHQRGIVHRDIKPENIMVGGDGHVTIMDFGLAQLTQASLLTRPDQTLGTTFYMSPEQTEGSGTDQRTDIWSLGVVLYEMLTGQKPFKGDYDKAVMYSILNEEPEPITAVRTGVPMELERIANKCLAKQPEERYQHASDLGVDVNAALKQLQAGRSAVLSRPGVAVVGRTEPPAAKGRERLAWAAAGILVIACLALLSPSGSREEPSTDASPAKFEVTLPEGQVGYHVEISPDGRYIAFTLNQRGGRRLFVHDLQTGSAEAFNGVSVGSYTMQPFWSPDSRFLAFFSDGQLRKIEISRGIAQTVARFPDGRRGSWGDGETILLFSSTTDGRMHKVSAAGGTPVLVRDPERDEAVFATWPHFLPGGRHLLYRDADHRMALASLYFSETRVLLDAQVTGAVYAGDGFVVYVRGSSLFAQPFDSDERRLTGEPTALASGIWSIPEPGITSFSASGNGRLVYNQVPMTSRLWWFERSGRPVRALELAADYQFPVRLSPDGGRIAVPLWDPSTAKCDLWILETERNAPITLPVAGSNDFGAVWSPDGGQLLSSTDGHRQGGPRLRMRTLKGQLEHEVIEADGRSQRSLDWSLDGRFVLYMAKKTAAGDFDMRVMDMSDQQTSVYLEERGDQPDARFSRNGNWVAYTSSESGEAQVWVAPFRGLNASPGRSERIQVSTQGGQYPVWSHGGGELYYRRADGKLVAVSVRTGEKFEMGTSEELFDIDGRFDVHPDGRFLVVRREGDTRAKLTVIMNWPALLNQ